MKIKTPILTSILDSDLYKFTMQEVIFHDFPFAIAEYEFINRSNTSFPLKFATELWEQVVEMQQLQLTTDEANWLNTIPYLRPTYIEWLKGYQYNPHDVSITQAGWKFENFYSRTVVSSISSGKCL